MFEVMNRKESADAVMAELEELMDPEIEWVNPEDAIESGTRRAWLECGRPSRTSRKEREAGRRGSSRRYRSAVSASSLVHANLDLVRAVLLKLMLSVLARRERRHS